MVGAAGVKVLQLFNKVMEEEILPGRRMRKTQREQQSVETVDWRLAFTPEDKEQLDELLKKTNLFELLERGFKLRHKIDEGEAAVAQA